MGSAMRAARARLDIAAHNLANAGSDGFRAAVARVRLGAAGLEVRPEAGAGQGAPHDTGRRFDLALLGPGAFDAGGVATRNGAFSRAADGRLLDTAGRPLRGRGGELRVSESAEIAPDGSVRDRGRVVDRLALPAGTAVRSGALEASTADPIAESLAVLDAQRAFETAQKAFVAIDEVRQRAVDGLARPA